MGCKKDQNKENCNCTYSCSKKGVCCDCITYHRKLGQLPACYFPNDVERTYDRSIKKFLETVNEKGHHWN
jgi:Domain of unknown function (DUF6485)